MTAAKDSELPDPSKLLLDHEQIQHRLLLVEIKAAMQKHSNILQIPLICTWNETTTASNVIQEPGGSRNVGVFNRGGSVAAPPTVQLFPIKRPTFHIVAVNQPMRLAFDQCHCNALARVGLGPGSFGDRNLEANPTSFQEGAQLTGFLPQARHNGSFSTLCIWSCARVHSGQSDPSTQKIVLVGSYWGTVQMKNSPRSQLKKDRTAQTSASEPCTVPPCTTR